MNDHYKNGRSTKTDALLCVGRGVGADVVSSGATTDAARWSNGRAGGRVSEGGVRLTRKAKGARRGLARGRDALFPWSRA